MVFGRQVVRTAPQYTGHPTLLNTRPNDGSGFWADYSNTGYLHDPGYTGTGGNCVHGYPGLNDYQAGMTSGPDLFVDDAAGHTYNQIHFRGTVVLGHTTGDNYTFNGCVFDNGGAGGGEQNFITQSYLPTAYTQNYCTFKPCDYTAPPGNNGTVTTAPNPPGVPCDQSWQSFNVNSNGSQTGNAVVTRRHCDIWGNAGMQDIFSGTSGSHVTLDHCYIHDQADTDSRGACGYHHDGIGPTTGTNTGYIDVTNCTVASLGNTEGWAMETTGGVQTLHDCTLRGNYWCGWGYTINFGGSDHLNSYNITFENNVFSAEIPWIFGPMFANWSWNSGGTPPTGNTQMLWRNNYWQWRAGDQNALMDSTYQGQFWWPTDNNPHASDYTG